MNNLKRWLKVLKSGKYKVYTNDITLRKDDNSFSLAGLASDMYIKATKRSSWRNVTYFTETNNMADFPESVLKWLGINGEIKLGDTGYVFTCLSNIHKPLKQVITLVEETLKKEGIL